MVDLSTTYMGVKLNNPLIVGASFLTANPAMLKRIEGAGAGAVVIKSLFEEEIQLERWKFNEAFQSLSGVGQEAATMYPHIEHGGPAEHLMMVRNAKESLHIPVFASLNAVNKEIWIEYAYKLAETGIDGLELNFFAVPENFEQTGQAIEDEQMEIVEEIVRNVKIPVSLKLSPFYTNIPKVIADFDKRGARGVVIFNRFIQPAIDVETQSNITPFNLSSPLDLRLPLRFTGLLFKEIRADICSSTGIHRPEDAISVLLAGAQCFQTVSSIYKFGANHVKDLLGGIEQWMSAKGYSTLNDFRGKLSRKNSPDPWAYTRSQYIKTLFNWQSFLESKSV